MTPEVAARIKQQTWERMRERNGDEWVEQHAQFLEAEWEWAKELRMIDEETDLVPEG